MKFEYDTKHNKLTISEGDVILVLPLKDSITLYELLHRKVKPLLDEWELQAQAEAEYYAEQDAQYGYGGP